MLLCLIVDLFHHKWVLHHYHIHGCTHAQTLMYIHACVQAHTHIHTYTHRHTHKQSDIGHRSDATSYSLLAGTSVLYTRKFACTRIGFAHEFALTRMALTREFAGTRISLAREFRLNITSWFVTRKQTLKPIAN